jgi:predicted nucleic acid-binding protein
MTGCVVDASVAVKWYLEESGSDHALLLLNGAFELHAPDLIYVEVANVLWKRALRGDLSAPVAQEALRNLKRVPIHIEPMTGLVDLGLDIAFQSGRSAYDSLYIALAADLGVRLVTADLKLVNALKGTAWENKVTWVEDLVDPTAPQSQS